MIKHPLDLALRSMRLFKSFRILRFIPNIRTMVEDNNDDVIEKLEHIEKELQELKK